MSSDHEQGSGTPEETPQKIVLSVSGVEKMYEIYAKPLHRLLQYIVGPRKKYYTEFWALKDINFEIRKGESFGIMGRNGAGKTTLLQCIAGTLTKTGGRIVSDGRMTALLELGSGFNPDFTGRENVYMNGTVLGIGRKDMDKRIQSIEEFADIGDFFDRPVKTYSQGMYARLAFSVMANIDPDILIIDEALAVGDAIFRHRCMLRINQLKDRGTTILYVAHDAGSVRRLCDRVLWLDNGKMKMIGPSAEVIQAYLEDQFEVVTESNGREPIEHELEVEPEASPNASPESAPKTNPKTSSQAIAQPVKGIGDGFPPIESTIPGGDYRVGDRLVEILGVGVYNSQRQKSTVIEAGGDMYLRLSFANKSPHERVQSLQTGWTLKNNCDEDISALHSGTQGSPVPELKPSEQVTVTWKIRIPFLQPGSYAVTMGVSVLDETGKPCVADRIVNVAVIHVIADRVVQGMIRFETDIDYCCSLPSTACTTE